MLRYYIIAAVVLAFPVYGLFGLFTMLGGPGPVRFVMSAGVGLALMLILGHSFKLLAEQKQKREDRQHGSGFD